MCLLTQLQKMRSAFESSLHYNLHDYAAIYTVYRAGGSSVKSFLSLNNEGNVSMHLWMHPLDELKMDTRVFSSSILGHFRLHILMQ